MNAQLPGPLAVMPCPDYAGKHPFHDSRWIATADAEVERGYDTRSGEWSLARGTLIAQMRDVDPATARLLAASYTAFDRAGRALNCDAAELAERVDLVSLIRLARRAAVIIADEFPASDTRREVAGDICAALSTFPRETAP